MYYLIALLIQRGLVDNSDAWTYELEKKLLLGLCSNSDALTSIESHSLGARLMTVVEKKRFDVTTSIEEVKNLLMGAASKIADIQNISIEYVHERKAQYLKLSGPLEQAIGKYERSVGKIDDFSTKLIDRNKKMKDKRVDKLIDDLAKEISQFKTELKHFRRELARFEDTLFGSQRKVGNG